MYHVHSTGTDEMVNAKVQDIAINPYYSNPVRDRAAELIADLGTEWSTPADLRYFLRTIEKGDRR